MSLTVVPIASQLGQPGWQLPDRPADGHKGTFGTVVAIGGCVRMPGAAAIVCRAALRSGAGLVQVVTEPAALPTVLSIEPCATGFDTGQDTWPEKAVYAIGPGWGRLASPDGVPLDRVPATARRVIDADGLNRLADAWASENASVQRALLPGAGSGKAILTPHPGEFRRLAEPMGIDWDPMDPNQRPQAVLAMAQQTQAVVLLKGRHTVVSDGQAVYVNDTGSPAMATAGSGDVLTGLIAGLWAQGLDALPAACLGAMVHGMSGEAWAQVHGPAGLRALDLADGLPQAMLKIRQENRSKPKSQA